MATYYKYAERSADSQVNWAEVGKGISDMLKDEVRIREEKKAAYDKAYQDDMQELANAPQGKWQDGNDVVNNFAHDMMAQKLIDSKLLKSGQMKERDYTLRSNNYNAQTKTLFELQKLLQSERQSTIEQYQAGDIQGMNISNMSDAEAYKNFADSKAIIDPYAATINMAIYETKIVDGKEVKVVKRSTPVNVLKGQILQKIPTFKVDEAVAKDVDALGVDFDFIYDAAEKTKSGTITQLIGYGALAGEYAKKDKNGKPLYPEFADSVKKTNDAIEQTIDKYFANPYNISSVLTENTGKYSAESYVWDKDVASKDKTKLLKKINPLTGLTILDEDAPHYKEQVQEARDWVKKRILSQLDSKREIKETGTIPYGPQQQQWQYEAGKEKKDALNAVGAWNQLFTGKTAAAKRDAADILLGTPKAQALELLEIDLETQPGSVILKYKDSKNDRVIPMQGSTLADFASKGVELHGVADRKLAMSAGGGGTSYGAISDFTGVKSSRAGAAGTQDYTPNVEAIAADVVNLIEEDNPAKTQKNLINKYSNLGFSFKGRTSGLSDDIIDVTDPSGKTTSYNIDNKDDATALQDLIIKKFDRKAAAKVFGAQQSKKPAGKTTVAGGKER
jgi:hypothetical protein